jgi:hypothetical protein
MRDTIASRLSVASRKNTMPEMMGVVLLVEMLSKDGHRPHEFEEFRYRSRLSSRIGTTVKRLRQRWMR